MQISKRKEEIRNALLSADPEEIARQSGANLEEGQLHFSVFGEKHEVNTSEYQVKSVEGECPEELEIIILDYILRATDSGSSGEWLGFQEIPNGDFYSANFKSNTESKLTREFQGEMESFSRVAKKLGGDPIPLGDAGFSFPVFPRFDIAFVFWDGGKEFRDKVNVLFEATAPDCLPTEGLSILGKKLCDKFLNQAEVR